jgi:hypothetical protein
VNAYRQIFVDFSQAELASGGPDPQVALTGRTVALRDVPPQERAILCGLFVAPYACGSAAVLWYLRDAQHPMEHWASFLAYHKEGFPIRRERRSVWGDDKVKMVQCVQSWIDWCDGPYHDVADKSYDEIFASISKHAHHFGRYATMKVIETMFHARVILNGQSSICAKDAKYPRKMLALMFPEHAERMNSKANDAEMIALANALAAEAASWLDRPISWFQLETLLCNSRQSLDGKYAGRSHDRELAHWRRANGHFMQHGIDLRSVFPFYQQRAAMFPHDYLGERGDPPWWGSREQLEVEQKARIRDALAAV